MSYYSSHLAWQQRVQCETRQTEQELNRVVAGRYQNNTEASLNDMYHYLFNHSVSYKPKSFVLKKLHATQTGVSRVAGLQRRQEPKMIADSTLKAFIPTEYFQHVGYDIPKKEQQRAVTAQSRTDSLGQKVRDRFNEDLAYSEPGQKQLKLTTKLMSDQKSQASSIRVRSIHSSYKRPLSQPKKFISDFTMSQARSLINRVLSPAPQPIEDVAPQETQIAEEEEPSAKSQVILLEQQLKEEREKRELLELEMEEVQKLNQEIMTTLN